MSRELSDEDAQKLFNEIAAASGDHSKLDQLLATTPDPEDDKPDVVPPVEDDKVDVEDPTDPDKSDEEDKDPSHDDDPAKDSPKDEDTPDEDPKLKELREQLKALEGENHKLRSQAGRVPHIQRKLKEYDRKLEELDKRASSPSGRPSSAIQAKVLEKLKGIRETDSELADAIASAFAVANEEYDRTDLDRDRETLKLLKDQELETYRAEQLDLLVSWYPNASEVVNSPSWEEWKKEQSQGILALAHSDNASEVAHAFRLYSEDMQKKYPDLVAKQPEAKAPASPNNEEALKAAQIEEERKRRKETSVVKQSNSAPGKVKGPDDEEALFKKFYEEALKARTG